MTLPTPNPKTIIIDLGWLTVPGEVLNHHFKTREGLQTAVASCGKFAAYKSELVTTDKEHCAACNLMEALRSDGLTPLFLKP